MVHASHPEPEHRAADRYRQALATYQDRSRDRGNLAGDGLLLRGRIRTTEQELRGLPRLRRRGRRAELTTRLDTDRRQLDTALERLRELDDELHTLKSTLDDLRADAAREAARLQRTYVRPIERTSQLIMRRRPTPDQPDP